MRTGKVTTNFDRIITFMDKKIIIMIVFPFLLILTAYIAGKNIKPESPLTDMERKILRFSPQEMSLPELRSAEVKRVPLERAIPDPEPAVETVMDISRLQLMSVLITEDRKMAIINDGMFRKGDSIDNMIISDIQPDKVLLKIFGLDVNGKPVVNEVWIKMEGAR